MTGRGWVPYSYSVLRAVPHVHVGSFVNVGVLVHARTAGFLGFRGLTDPGELAALAPEVDAEMLARYLHTVEGICAGEAAAGPIALAPPSERVHWLTAPRSDVLQPSPPHAGLCLDPAAELESLFASCVAGRGC